MFRVRRRLRQLTIFTDHHLGLIRILPYRLHLAVDLAFYLNHVADTDVDFPVVSAGKGAV